MIASTQTNHPIAHLSSQGDAKNQLETACKALKSAGLRITQPRIAILNVLINSGQPVSIEHIHSKLNQRSCDLVTVYRCLSAFEEIGLVQRTFFHNGTSLYRISRPGNVIYHVVSKDTQSVEVLDPETTAELHRAISKVEQELMAKGYTEVSHLLEFFAKSPSENSTGRLRNQNSIQVPTE